MDPDPPVLRHPGGLGPATIALVGTPNSGKTTLFNALTGMRQKVANYPGVTVERKVGLVATGGRSLAILDLPGLYSLRAQTPDEEVSRSVLAGENPHAPLPEAVLIVLDGSALERSLAFASTLLGTGLPTAACLTMFDEIKARGGRLDMEALSRELGIPVVPVVGHRGIGIEEVRRLARSWEEWPKSGPRPGLDSPSGRYAWARGLLARSLTSPLAEDGLTRRLDRFALHPVAGPLLFLAVIALFFQAVFSWAAPAQDALAAAFSALGRLAGPHVPDGLPRVLVVQGLFEGVGSVVSFLPQILVLFFILFLLEDVGYMARAAFLTDRLMGSAGLQGRSFIALVSSYACAVPGIMATRAVPEPKDRLATILVAPFMTCSARLPVYALLIGAFVPDRPVLGPLRSQGLTLFGLYAVGSLSAFGAAWLLRSTILRGRITPFYMELPPYRFPALKSVLLAMLDRARIFLRRAGTVILGMSMAVALLTSLPARPDEPGLGPEAQAQARLESSFAGRLGGALEPVFRPLGFDWRINVALLGSLAAREIAVSTLAQIYAVDASAGENQLRRALREGRDPRTGRPFMPLAVALSLLAFFVYALQCLSTLAVMRRETNGWRWPAFAFAYMLACAWLAAFATYNVSRALGA